MVNDTDNPKPRQSCAYNKLATINANTFSPGNGLIAAKPGQPFATDASGNAVYTSSGHKILVGPNGVPIPMQITAQSTCGPYATITNGYSMTI